MALLMNEIGEYRFGVCRIDIPAREVWRDNELISTEPKVFDLLTFLIRNRNRAALARFRERKPGHATLPGQQIGRLDPDI